MKNVYIDKDISGIPYVREIIPAEATPIAEWYNEQFASHCIEAPDEVEQNWVYSEPEQKFYPPGTDIGIDSVFKSAVQSYMQV